MNIILDDEFVTFKDGGFRRFLVKWHDRLDYDAIWIQEDNLRHLDPSLLDCYLSSQSSESSFFQLSGMIGHGIGPYLGLDEIGSPNLRMIFIIISYLFYRTFWICLLRFLLVLINNILCYLMRLKTRKLFLFNLFVFLLILLYFVGELRDFGN